jgi:hypothetical protein
VTNRPQRAIGVFSPEPRDDEQRVVDPDAEPDHRHEQGRDRVDVGQPGEDEQEDERRRERAQREEDGDQRRDEGPEDDEQDDQRRQEAEQLLRALLNRWELGVAVVLDRHPGGLDLVSDSVLDGDDLVAVFREDGFVELRLGIGDPPVLRERVRAERVADALDADLILRRLELGRLELRDRSVDRLLAVGGVERLAVRRRKDEVEDPALLGRELRFDQVGRLLGLRAGNREFVFEAAADRDHEHDEERDDADPAEDDPPGMGGADSRPAGKAAGREPLVGSAPIRRRGPVSVRSWLMLRHSYPPFVLRCLISD